MNQPPKPVPLSPAFAAKEYNGADLLKELQHLRDAVVNQKHLNDCALAVRNLPNKGLLEAMMEIKQLAMARFQGQPELARLLVTWAAQVKGPKDFMEMCGHFQRLAVTSALLAAMYRGASRLPNAQKKK
ncbi:MAG TPA: hypothetical protein VFA20_10835 [Myxococcaceae bacterium]|nr:hypothetical protein [Myxococcaceae bacterium]